MTLEDKKQSHSRWWYLVPIILGFVGGIIAYVALRKDDPKLAKRCLIVGILITIIPFVIGVFLVLYGTMFAGHDYGNSFQGDVSIFEESICEPSPVQFSNIYSNEPPMFVGKWGSFGTEGGQFGYPVDIAVDSKSNVYVTDSGARDDIYRVQKFSSDGNFILEWGSAGTKDGEFMYLTTVVIDSNDDVYVNDFQNSRIQKFTNDGEFITKWDTIKYDNILGLTADSFNNIYGLEGNESVRKWSSDGNTIAVWHLRNYDDLQIAEPNDIATDTFDQIYLLDDSRIHKFDCNGNFLTTINIPIPQSFPGRSQNMHIDSSGSIYITSSSSASQILKFANDGEFITKWGSKGSDDGQFVGAGNVAVDSTGQIFVIDTTHGRIQKFI